MRLRIVVAVLMLAGAAYGAWTDEPVAAEGVPTEVLCDAAVDGSHGLLVVWEEDTAGNWAIYADRIDPLCRRMWVNRAVPGINISNAAAFDCQDAAICADGSLGAYIVWTQDATTDREIYAARVGPTGEFYPEWLDAMGPPPVPKRITVSANGCFHPDVCYSGGQVYIAYKNDVYAGSKLPALEVACYNPAGELQWTTDIGPAGVQTPAPVEPLRIRMWPDSEQGVLVVWERGQAGGEDASTFAIRLDKNGDGIWGQDPVELYRLVGGVTSRGRAVCPDGEGGLYVAGPFYIPRDVDDVELKKNNGELIIVNHLNYSGLWEWGDWDWGVCVTPLVAGQWAGVAKVPKQENPTITSISAGGCVVAWVDNRWPCNEVGTEAHPLYGTNGLSIYAQYIDASGSRMWDEQMEYYKQGETIEIEVLPGMGRNAFKEGAPLAADDAATYGRIYAGTSSDDWPCFVWADNRDGDLDIYAEEPRLCDGLALRGPTANIEVSAGDVPNTFVYAADPRWGGYVVWTNAGADVYAAHINYYADSFWRGSPAVGDGPDVFPPPPVRDFHGRAEVAHGWIRLTWSNPSLQCGGEYLGTSNATAGQTFVTERRDLDPDPLNYDLYSVDGAVLFGATTKLAYAAPQGSQILHVLDASGLVIDQWIRLHTEVAGVPVDIEYFQVESTDIPFRGGEYLGQPDGTVGQTLTTDGPGLSTYDLYSVNDSLFGATTALNSVAPEGSRELHVADATAFLPGDWVRLDDTNRIEYFQVESKDTTNAEDHVVYLESRIWTSSGFAAGSTLTRLTAAPTVLAEEDPVPPPFNDYAIDPVSGVVTLTGTIAAPEGEYLGLSNGTGGQVLTADRVNFGSYELYSVNNSLFGATAALISAAPERSLELHVADASAFSADDWVRLDDAGFIEYFQVELTDTTVPGDNVVYLKSRIWTSSGFAAGSTLTLLTAAPTALTEATDYSIDVATGDVTLAGTVAAGDEVIIAYDLGDEVIIAYDTLGPYDHVVYLKSRVWTPSGFAVDSTLTALDDGAPVADLSPYVLVEEVAVPPPLNDYGIDTDGGVVTLAGTVADGEEVIIAYETVENRLDDLWGVMIRRGAMAAPLTIGEGTHVDGGPGMPGAGASECFDSKVEIGRQYYYTAFAYDTVTDANFSAGTACLDNPVQYGMGEVRNLTAIPGDRAVALTWANPPVYDGIKAYRPDDTGALVYEGMGQSCMESGLVNGDEYTYTVYALQGGTPSSGVRVTAVPLKPVSDFVVEGVDSGNILTWTNPTSVDPQAVTWFGGVRIQCSLAAHPQHPDDGVTVHEGSGESFNHAGLFNGTTYYYTIYVYDDKPTTHFSAGVTGSGTAGDKTPPAEVTNLTATPGNQLVTLEWDNPMDLDFAGVEVHRKNTETSDTNLVFSGVTEILYDQTVTNGTEYEYTVRTYDDKDPANVSAGSLVTVTPTVDVPPRFLSGPTVTAATDVDPVVVWTTNVLVTGRAEYGTTLALGQTSEEVDSTGTETPYSSTLVLTDLRPGATYYCRIRIVDDAGNSKTEDAMPYPFWIPLDSGSDTDGDGMPDIWEDAQGFDKNDDTDAALDKDGDGLTNLEEYQHGTDPDDDDTDDDLKSDGDEVDDQTNPLAPDGWLPMRDRVGGCGSAAALAAILALAAWRRRRK